MTMKLGLPESEWPIADQRAWRAALAIGELFDESGLATSWRPTTLARAKYAYGQWLRYLTEHDRESVRLQPTERLTAPRLRDYATSLQQRMSMSGVAAALGHLLLAARAVGPSSDWKWLRDTHRRCVAAARPQDKRGRLVADAADLFHLGESLMATATNPAVATQRRSYRDGLIIALLAHRPLRRSNLAQLRLGKNVHVTPAGVEITLEPDDTKNKRSLRCSVPEALVHRLRRYIDQVRPCFSDNADHDFLWCSTKGGALRADGIYQMISKRTQTAFGHPINPHLFRDIAATTLATERPEHVRLAKDLLGHAGFGTTEQHYLHAGSIMAGREYQKVLKRIRSSSCSMPLLD